MKVTSIMKAAICLMVLFNQLTAMRLKKATITSKHGHKSPFTFDKDVMELNSSNFVNAVNTFEYLFVKFYAPWCHYCRRLAPKWNSLARRFRQDETSRVTFAHINGEVSKDIGDQYKVNIYHFSGYFRGFSVKIRIYENFFLGENWPYFEIIFVIFFLL